MKINAKKRVAYRREIKIESKKDSTSIRDLCIYYGRLFAKYYVNLVTDD